MPMKNSAKRKRYLQLFNLFLNNNKKEIERNAFENLHYSHVFTTTFNIKKRNETKTRRVFWRKGFSVSF